MSDDRRDFPRIETEHSVEIIGSDGASFPTLALDLSLTGMQLLCDQPTAERIAPAKSIHDANDNPIELDVRLRVKLREGDRERLKIRCQLMSLREMQQDEIRIGVKFTHFEGNSYHVLEAYIDESLPD